MMCVCVFVFHFLPFCLRTDRSSWRKCIHCSTFPLCIQSNMSPPLTEHAGIGCMTMGARSRPAIISTDRQKLQQKHNHLLGRSATRPLCEVFYADQLRLQKWQTAFIVKNGLRQATPCTPQWLELVTWLAASSTPTKHVVHIKTPHKLELVV